MTYKWLRAKCFWRSWIKRLSKMFTFKERRQGKQEDHLILTHPIGIFMKKYNDSRHMNLVCTWTIFFYDVTHRIIERILCDVTGRVWYRAKERENTWKSFNFNFPKTANEQFCLVFITWQNCVPKLCTMSICSF